MSKPHRKPLMRAYGRILSLPLRSHATNQTRANVKSNARKIRAPIITVIRHRLKKAQRHWFSSSPYRVLPIRRTPRNGGARVMPCWRALNGLDSCPKMRVTLIILCGSRMSRAVLPHQSH